MKKILNYASLFIIAIALTFSFSIKASAENACSGYKNGSNECRVGERGKIVVAGNEWRYRNLDSSETTTTTRDVVSATGEKSKDGEPVNYYKTVNIKNIFDGKNSNSYFTAFQESKGSLFCMDAQYEGGSKLYAERFLLDKNEPKKTQAYDAAIMSILLNNGIMRSTVSDIQAYWAKTLAIRAITYTFGYYNSEGIVYKGALYSGLTATNSWSKKASSEIQALKDMIKKTDGGSINIPAAKEGYSFSGPAVDLAYNYYVTAIKDATEYLKKPTSSVETISIKAEDIVTTGNAKNQKVSRDVVHTIILKGFNNSNAKFQLEKGNNNGVQYAEGTKYDGLDAYISKVEIDGGPSFSKSAGDIDSIYNTNWAENGWLTKDEVTVKITVHFEGWKTSTNPNQELLKCGQQPIKYSLNGIYNASGSNKFDKYVGTIWYSGESHRQRYLGIEELRETNDTKWSSPNNGDDDGVSLIPSCGCEDLIEACTKTNNVYSKECKELKNSNCGECSYIKAACDINPNSPECDEDKYNAVCDITCETVYTPFECCDEENNTLIVSPNDNHKVSILGPGPENEKSDNIKACFVSKVDTQCQGKDTDNNSCSGAEGIKDQKGNSHTLVSMQDNKYCTVSCKEDYVMTMPTAKLVNAGRYFTFKARVEGTKTCYTNTIDREQYNKDIIEKQEAIYKAYNGYIRYQTALESNPHSNPTVTACHSCTAYCHGTTCNSQITYVPGSTTDSFNYTAYYPTFNKKTGQVINLNPTTEYGPETETSIVTHSGDSASCSRTCSDGKGGTTTCYCTHSCSYVSSVDEHDGAYLTAKLTRLRDKYLKELNDAIEDYNNTITQYNECSKWDSEINYKPEVYYEYEENYMNLLNNHMGEMIENKSNVKNEDWYCNGTPSNSNFTYGTISTDYDKCSNSNSFYSEHLMKYIVCSSSSRSCYLDTESYVSDANYKKVTSKINASYKPKTLFYNVYPSGEITVNKADNNVPLENKLPVSLGTERGIYKYTVNINKLGEFYNSAAKDNLGRYVGSNTAVLEDEIVDGVLPYNCSYLVNIQKTDGWPCKFNDKCTGDCLTDCSGPGCGDVCEGIDCVADCIGVGCIYDSGAGSSINQKIVSLKNMFPNGTNSYNWTNAKGNFTKTQIQEKNENIFKDKPILSLTINPTTAKEIKKYNDEAEKDMGTGSGKNPYINYVYGGGYSNDTVYCEDKNGYKQIACYSSFIDDLLEGKYGKDVVNSNSLIAEENYRSTTSNYFTLWNNNIAPIAEDKMIGPSWK